VKGELKGSKAARPKWMKPCRESSPRRVTRVVLAAACLSMLAIVVAATRGAAQSPAASLPPLPVGEKNFPTLLAPVVEAEHAFAEYSIAHGMKDAFLNFAAPDGVIFRRGPVNAIEAWTRTNPAPTGLLTWWPVYADVSEAGDLGYTTGPYEYRDKPSDAKPEGAGHYFTIWRRQPDGSWRFVVDLGIQHEAPASAETVLRYPAWLSGKKKASRSAEAEAAAKSLLEAERALSEESSTKGTASALLSRADETLRLYRQNTFPVVGREAVRKTLKTMSEFVRCEPSRTDASASGDMGYAYGTYELRTSPGDQKPAERGNYARVWRRTGKGPWRVVFNVTNPVR
jgi:ketosteroid isomerase-like protein